MKCSKFTNTSAGRVIMKAFFPVPKGKAAKVKPLCMKSLIQTFEIPLRQSGQRNSSEMNNTDIDAETMNYYTRIRTESNKATQTKSTKLTSIFH